MRPISSSPKGTPPTNQQRSVWSLIILLFLLGFMTLSAAVSPDTPTYIPKTTALQTETVLATDTIAPPTETPTPKPFEENPEQTNGIVLGGVLLVLIIVGGTVSIIRRKE